MSLKKILGQNQVAEMLSNSIKNQRINHAYIFAGPNGVGKSQMARQFAKALNCLEMIADACDHCSSCKKIDNYNHQSVYWIEPDGSSIKIEQIRQLQKDFFYKAVEAEYQVLIIKQAEKMTQQAANSLLKFLEEPASAVVIILLTENTHRLLTTIISRCQIVNFLPLEPGLIEQLLADEGFGRNEIYLAAHLTTDINQVRELLNGEQFAQMRTQVIQWSEDICFNKYQSLIAINDKIIKNSYINDNLHQFLDLLLLWYRDVLNKKLFIEKRLVYQGYREQLSKQAEKITERQLINSLDKILFAKKQLSSYVNPQIALENLVLTIWEG